MNTVKFGMCLLRYFLWVYKIHSFSFLFSEIILALVDGCMSIWLHEWIDGWINGWVDRWIGSWIDGQVETIGWLGGCSVTCLFIWPCNIISLAWVGISKHLSYFCQWLIYNDLNELLEILALNLTVYMFVLFLFLIVAYYQ